MREHGDLPWLIDGPPRFDVNRLTTPPQPSTRRSLALDTSAPAAPVLPGPPGLVNTWTRPVVGRGRPRNISTSSI